MLNWLSSDEDLISIRPKDPENTPLDLSEAQMRRIFLFSLSAPAYGDYRRRRVELVGPPLARREHIAEMLP